MSYWVLQSGWEQEAGWTVMLDTLARFSIPHSIHTVVPFVGELEPEPHPETIDVICMGSYSMRHYARRKGWNPGVFDLAPYDFGVQRTHWGAAMLNADSEVVAFGDVRFRGRRFVRPADDTKLFTGAVFDGDTFAEWQHKVVALGKGVGSLTGESMVQVSSPKSILQEVRCWVVEGKVLTASIYRMGPRVVYSDEVEPRFIEFAGALAASWSPEKAYCLDVCETEDGLRVVEINTINSAGFYAADTQRLVMALDGLTR